MDDLEKSLEKNVLNLKYAHPKLSYYEYMAKGKDSFKKKHFNMAISHFINAYLSNPKEPESSLYLARSHKGLLPRVADTIAYKERAASAIKFYNKFLSLGYATINNYEEIVDLLENLDQKQFNFYTLEEAMKVCKAGTNIFFEPNVLHTKLYTLAVNNGEPDLAESTLEHVARHGDIRFILDNFDNLLDFEFGDENKPNTMLKILTDRIFHDDTIDRGDMAFNIAEFYRNNETNVPYELEFNRTMAIKFFKYAYDIDSLEYDEAREEIEILLIDSIERPMSENHKKRYEDLLTNFYKTNPDIEPAKILSLNPPKANSIIQAVENRPTPIQIASLLAQYVVGQEKAVQKFAVIGSEHMKRIQAKYSNVPLDEIPKKKLMNVHGPPGGGKTYTGESLAKVLGVPSLVFPAAGITEEGYVGDKPKSIFEQLVKDAGNLQDAERGIIILDEIDKLAGNDRSQGPDVSGAGAQKSLLKIVEGTQIKIFERTPHETMFDTTFVTFILMGSYAGMNNTNSNISTLDRIVYHRMYGDKKIGFGVQDKIKEAGAAKYAEPEDFVAFGMLPELVDRTSLFTYYQILNQKELRRILTEPKDSLVRSYMNSFAMDNIHLSFRPDALDLIAEKAYKMKGSARSLKKIMDNLMFRFEFNLPSSKVTEYEITEEDVIKSLEQD